MNKLLKELKTLYKTEEKEMTKFVKERFCFKTNKEALVFLQEVDPEGDFVNTIWENGYLSGLNTAINIVALENKNS